MLCWFCNWISVWRLLIGVHRPIQNIKGSFLVKPVMPLIGNLLPHATFILALCISLQQAVITLQNLWLHQRSHCYKCRLVTIKFLIFPHSFSFFSFFLFGLFCFFPNTFKNSVIICGQALYTMVTLLKLWPSFQDGIEDGRVKNNHQARDNEGSRSLRPDSFAAAVNTPPRASAMYVKSSINGRTITSMSREVTV